METMTGEPFLAVEPVADLCEEVYGDRSVPSWHTPTWLILQVPEHSQSEGCTTPLAASAFLLVAETPKPVIGMTRTG